MTRKSSALTLALTVAAAAAVLGGPAPLSTAAPQIRLVDDTIAIEPAPVDPSPTGPGDGSLAEGQVLTPFDVQNPAIGRLDPRLLTAIQDAANAAATEGVTMTVTSGWRSTDFQRRLMDDAVVTYGSVDIARQYVAAPEVSKHVIGEAVDIGGAGADQWLIANGSRFGLCQIYANELWHFELAADPAGSCPPLLPNAAG